MDDGGFGELVPVSERFRGVRSVVPFERGFDASYGLESVEHAAGLVRGRVAVVPRLLGLGEVVHSGVYASIAESLASIGTAAEVLAEGSIVSGLSNSTYVLADVRDGVLRAEARCRRRGAEWMWHVNVVDGDGTACSYSTVVIAVRPPRESS
ncbi:MAG: PaaI family thioesterase [Solirubrobacteraceae bacterium]